MSNSMIFGGHFEGTSIFFHNEFCQMALEQSFYFLEISVVVFVMRFNKFSTPWLYSECNKGFQGQIQVMSELSPIFEFCLPYLLSLGYACVTYS